jgi:hypothetical protein
MQGSRRKDMTSGGQKDTRQRMPPLHEPDGLPGGRAALPADSLSKPFFGPQGDENRTPQQKAPAPIKPAAKVPPGSNGPRNAPGR